MMRTFYRVNHETTQQGLWYDFNGSFTGLIHEDFAFCKNHELKMDFDPDVVGFVSVVETLDDLFKWFTREDILKLQDHGWFIHQYETDHFFWYERFQHWLMNQAAAKLVGKVILLPAE